MAVEDDHLRKPDLEQIEEFSRFTEIQSEIIANLKPSLSTSWTEFLQTSMLLPEPVIGPEVSLGDFEKYLQLGSLDFLSSSGDGETKAFSGQNHEHIDRDGITNDLLPFYFDTNYSIDEYLAKFQGTNRDSDNDLLDSLTKDLELVESRIIKEASSKNSSLLEISNRLDQLVLCMKSIQSTLRSTTSKISETRQLLVSQLRTASNCRCLHKNLRSLLEICQLVQDIVHTKAELENSLKAVNFGGLDWQLTLSLIDEMNIVLRTAPFNNDVYVCRNMEEYIERTTSFALKTMREEFLSMLSFNVDQCVENSISVDPATSSNSGEAQESENTAIPDKDKEKYLELLIVNLCKRNGLRESLDAYGHASEMSTRRIVVEILRKLSKDSCSLGAEDIDAAAWLDALSSQLSYLDIKHFIPVLHAYVAACKSHSDHCDKTEHLIIQVLKRHKQIGDLLLEAVEDSFLQIRHSRLEEMSSTWETFLQSLGEQSNFKPCINTLKEVSENTASLSTLLTDGLKDMNVSLGLAVHALGKSMLQQLQKESLKRISRALEEESWRFVDDLGVNAANLLELGHLLGIRIELPGTGQEPEMTSCSNIVVLQSVSFRLTHACLLTVAYFLDGLSLCEVVPSLAKDAAHQTLETMRMFNSKTCQLILGAGAMQVAGLRSITVKHLAVACHTLRFMLAIMPFLFQYFQKNSGTQSKLLATELHKTESDIEVHCTELISKIVDVVSDRFPNENDVRQSIASYHQPTGLEDVSLPSELATGACKQVEILEKILNSTCLLEDSKNILDRITQSLKRPYEVILAEGSDGSDTSRKPVEVDLNYLTECICQLDVSGIQ